MAPERTDKIAIMGLTTKVDCLLHGESPSNQVPSKLKRRNFFCAICKEFAEHVLLQYDNDEYPKWKCCHCNATLLEELFNEFWEMFE